MDIDREVVATVRDVLNLKDRAAEFTRSTPLLGSIPELDSMAVASLLTSLEERFGVVIEDDEVEGAIFETVGTLSDFMRQKVLG